jgi:type IV pilus assembly protein PilY1
MKTTFKNVFLAFGCLALMQAPSFAGTLSDTPLSLKGAVPPNVMFALSVEFPTANTAAYQDASGYSANNEYLGYFDPEKCYSYDTGNSWFYPVSITTNHTCSGGWSGNFLNWGTMTGLDEFRFAMTGGNRYRDTSTLTVLERSWQSGQGGTGNFPDKSFTDAAGTATPYPAGATVTLQNQNRGVQMNVTPSGSTAGVVTCTSPGLTGGSPPFGCTLTLQGTADTSTCTTWTGSGTSGSPYTCTAFGGFAGSVPSTSTAVTPALSVASGGSATTVTCSGPTLSGSSFDCTSIALANTHTGTCTSWTGSGIVTSPYVCTAFTTFSGGETFSPGAAPTVSTFTTTVPGAQVQDNGSGGGSSGRIDCTLSGSGASTTLTCPLSVAGAVGDNAICSVFVGAGTSGDPYRCSSFGFSGAETYVSSSYSSGTSTTYNSKVYRYRYRITYTLPGSTETKHYASSYPGSTGGSAYYYTGSYNVGFGASQLYHVRAKVCDTTIGAESNCKQYGSSWKPTGVLQDNGDKMRFGLTSYFQANDIDNAVLRSKAKYLAPQKYSSSGGLITNPYMEWNASTGELYRNPDNCDSGVSGCTADSATVTSHIGAVADTGVINYINKFGSNSHTYKTYDVVGKLYYETLKYLRHLSPTTDFYNGATAANADSFPVITQWDDPILYSCQKNYIITMGDTHTWCDKRLPGGTHAAANNGVCNAYTTNGNAHVADMGSLGGDSGVNVTTETNKVSNWEGMGNIAANYTGAGSSAGYTMAGLAAWAARKDIRPNTGDFAGKQNVTTYIIDVEEYKDCGYQSQYWLAAKYGNPASYDSNEDWLTSSNPWSQSQTLPAGVCSSRQPPGYNAAGGAVTWPKNLLRAGDPLAMITSVKSAISQIQAQIGDEAALAQSSGSLDTGTGAYIYRANYNSGGWTGDVQALLIDQTGTISGTPAWSAAAKLPGHSSRRILTYNDSTRAGVDFDATTFSTNLSTAQQALLNSNEFGTTDGLGSDRINYLRGDQSKEAFLPGTTTPNPSPNNGWRTRSSILGDVIDSNPIFVGPPASGFSESTYKTFATTYANRLPTVYVGANDGMLHGYDASYTLDASGNPIVTAHSGTELLGYVPASVYKNLSQLMAPNYSHKYFVDGSSVAADACFSGCTAATNWKTILVGSLNAGGQGVFLLDITDPATSAGSSNFAASNALWEFSDSDDADLGYTFSKPVVRKLNDGNWYVMFGNGYNNTTPDSHASTTGRAYLYLLHVEGPGTGNPWVLGTNYYKIELKSPAEPTVPTLPLTPPNGLSSVVAVDKNLDTKADYVYAGDRNGNIWKIDLTSATPSNWKSAFGTVTTPLPIFSAKDAAATPNAQQITTGLEIARHPNGGFMLMFGTGAWLDQQDPLGPFTVQSMYGIWDKDDGATTVSGRSVLQKQRVLVNVDTSGAACTVGTDNCYSVFSSCQPNYSTALKSSNVSDPLCPADIAYPNNTGQQLGWVFDMAGSGERIRSTFPKVSGKNVKFTSLTPATDPCTGNTIGLEYNLSFTTGGSPEAPLFVFPGNTTGYISLPSSAFPGYTGGNVQVVIGGQTIAGGAADTPVSFSARPPAGVVTPPANMPNPPTSACVGSACGPSYIPGWGFLMNLQGPTAAAGRFALVCHPPQFGAGLPSCKWEYKNAQFGRLNWKQIIR